MGYYVTVSGGMRVGGGTLARCAEVVHEWHQQGHTVFIRDADRPDVVAMIRGKGKNPEVNAVCTQYGADIEQPVWVDQLLNQIRFIKFPPERTWTAGALDEQE